MPLIIILKVSGVFAQGSQAQLKFERDTIDCNFKMKWQCDTIRFTFTNTGQSPLLLNRCYSNDSNVTVVSYTGGYIQPGATGSINVICNTPRVRNLHPIACPGGRGASNSVPFLYVLTVKSNAQTQLHSLVIKGTITTYGCAGPLRGRPPYSPPHIPFISTESPPRPTLPPGAR